MQQISFLDETANFAATLKSASLFSHILAYSDDLENCVGAARTSTLRQAQGIAKLSDHRRHRFSQRETPDALRASGVVTGF